MRSQLNASQTLDREFLEIRRRLLEAAAAFDRIDCAEGSDAAWADPRMTQLGEAARVLVDARPDRAERLQMIFSEPYEKNWRDT